MDRDRAGGHGGEPLEVEDEFACSGMLRGSLSSLHGTVERIFGVVFGIGSDDLASQDANGQIWLKLRGPSGDVEAAKLFVKGLVNQEEQQEVSYPGVLHCIFCGARGLFMDCLTKNTSAHIVVGSPGFLLISGLVEPVVRAYSLITDLLERCEAAPSRRSEAGERGPGESLDSRRAFKSLVEKWEDKHTLDLLVLPGSVKEILLDLARDSGLGSSPGPALAGGNAGAGSDEELEDVWVKPFPAAYTLPEPSRTTDRWVEGLAASSEKDSEDPSFRCVSGGTRGRAEVAEGAEGRLVSSPQEEAGEQLEFGTKMKKARGEEEGPELQLSVGNKEFWLLLKFFTAMGYTEDVVKRVLARTGPKEASQILDVVQQEQDLSDREQANGTASSPSERNRPCETEHREEEEMEVEGAGAAATTHSEGKATAEEKEEGPEEDFVLGVVKKAAASCGYMEQEVAKAYSMLPDRSTHQLLLELQREAAALREGPREMDDAAPEENGPRGGAFRGGAREVEPFVAAEKRKSDDRGRAEGPDTTASEFSKSRKPSASRAPHRVVLPEVKGPPTATYPSSLDLPLATIQPNRQYGHANFWQPSPSTSKPNPPAQDDIPKLNPKSSSVLKQALLAPQPHGGFARDDSSPTRARERRGFAAASSVVVTGEQRFMEGLQMPFDLKLTDEPGDPKVRTIVIDGSNVAMSHGLGHFFSCRGIALAVQHFWDRGHRHISALLPQWRQKSDPKIKEQHYLSELQKLGLLSFTPSREVLGKRISSYDDRLMLQLAQKTDGVIVTNDNLRDLSDETLVWRDIIKKRLLQYTFVGDHFMVPDDPLGRGGPHLDDFLRSEHRTPDPGHHSFAGAATTFQSSQPPRSQTELLNFRDRTPGGALANGAAGGGGRGKGRGHGKAWGPGHQLESRADRTAEETDRLRDQLCQVFPGQDSMVALVLQLHPAQTDMNVLSELILQ